MDAALQFPDYLNDELIHQIDARIRRKVRHFKVNEHEDDLAQEAWVFLSRQTNSGKSLLQSYDSEKGPLMPFVDMVVGTFMMKKYNKEKRRHRLAPEISTDQNYSGFVRTGDNALDDWHAAMPRQTPSAAPLPDDMTRTDVELLLVKLRHTTHARASRYNAAGEPFSNCYILQLLYLEDITATEIAERFEVSQSEVRRRITQLRADPQVRLLRDHG